MIVLIIFKEYLIIYIMFEELIDLEIDNYINYIVTPITPYLICDHFISDEINKGSGKYIDYDLKITANDLLKNNNYSCILNGDIIQVSVDRFNYFYDQILPLIKLNNKKIILITSQYHLPQLHRSERTDNILKDENILLWVSQNPIYTNNEKYMGFPYGINQNSVNDYMNYVKGKKVKEILIFNPRASVHGHLPYNHIRRQHEIFGKNSGPSLDYKSYLQKISQAEFVISTPGDRDDSYRHYECIGLKAIPVSNIQYKSIFGENMIYSNALEMINMVENNLVNYKYNEPNQDILTIKYWVKKIQEIVKN